VLRRRSLRGAAARQAALAVSVEPILKHGELISATYREYVAAQRCAHCGREPKSEVHHFPGRGAAGVIFDLRTCPLCRECHVRAGGGSVWLGSKRLLPIDADKQTSYVAQTWQRFVERAPWAAVDQVFREIRRWREARGEMVPW
jgi:hypothetical protein